jgi:hypothetical protein
MAIPAAKSGRYYFECYPHPALLGVFGLDQIVKYKLRHKNTGEWHRIIDLLRSLTASELPVRNICSFVREGLAENKANEDKLDAIISAYTAAYWWKFGIDRSTMIGDLTAGYIVTPPQPPHICSLGQSVRPAHGPARASRPAVLFLPFGNQGNQQCGMKASHQQMNRGLWSFMVADAARTNPAREIRIRLAALALKPSGPQERPLYRTGIQVKVCQSAGGE